MLSWLHLPDDDFAPAVRAGVDLGVSSRAHLAGVLAGARRAGRPARLHLKIDTGLTRNGAQPADWDRLLDDAVRAAADGTAEVVAVWSHLAQRRHPGAPDQRPAGRPAHRGLAGGPRPRAATRSGTWPTPRPP